MTDRLVRRLVWLGIKWLVQRRMQRSSWPERAKYAGGVLVVVAVFAYVLSRSEGEEPETG
jgi:hypothetical protein